MIRKVFALLLILVIMVSCLGCQVQDSANQTTAAATVQTTEAPTTQATIPPETTQPEEPDFYDLVFDTSDDAGKLTARYLNLTLEDETGEVYPGDCAIYTSPDGYTMLVDCGSKFAASEMVAQLQDMGLERIDIVVISHPHADHVGGFVTLTQYFEIGQVYTNGHNYGTSTFQDAMARTQELNIPCEILSEGDTFMFGEEVLVEVFGPSEEALAGVSDLIIDANDCSIAMRLSYGDSSFWTSGDLYTTGEGKLVDAHGEEIQSDVVKMNHHGKDTSNASQFVKAVGGKIAVGMLNNVSSQTVALRYMVNGAEPFYTAADGAIRISTSGDGVYDVQTQLLREVPFLNEPAVDGHYVIGG